MLFLLKIIALEIKGSPSPVYSAECLGPLVRQVDSLHLLLGAAAQKAVCSGPQLCFHQVRAAAELPEAGPWGAGTTPSQAPPLRHRQAVVTDSARITVTGYSEANLPVNIPNTGHPSGH